MSFSLRIFYQKAVLPKFAKTSGTRYDGTETSRPNRSVPGHHRASAANGQNPAEAHTNFHTNHHRRRNANSNHQRRQDHSSGCRKTHRPYVDALRQRNLPPPQKGRSHPLNHQRHFREFPKAGAFQIYKRSFIKGCVCLVCVAWMCARVWDTIKPHRVASTCMGW